MTKDLFKIIAPGILVAATGVGAGDLITAGLGGHYAGLSLIWAPLLGGVLKWSLNEGLVRWQLSTETSLMEGWFARFGKVVRYIFLAYLLIWSFMVGGALINASGAAMHALVPLSEDLSFSKGVWGVIHSFLGVILVRYVNFSIFEKIMSFFIGAMFLIVVITAFMLKPDLSELISGLVPSFPQENLGWILGVLGGVGGTLTILSYGYWIQEGERKGSLGLKHSQIDLAVAYTVVALFSVAMIIIGSQLAGLEGDKSVIPTVIASKLGELFGPTGRWFFLFGFWAGVFSSLLGVWQSVPYIFSDFYYKKQSENLSKTKAYFWYMIAIATVPIVTLFINFETIQLGYAVLGAFFMPLLALSLLILNNSSQVGSFKNRWIQNTLLVMTLLLFSYTGLVKFL